MPIEPDLDDEATPDDLDYYYGLNRRNAQKQDAPFANTGLIIMLGGAAIIPLAFLFSLLSRNGLLIIMIVVLVLTFPAIVLMSLVMGSLAFSSLVQLLRQFFTFKNK